MVYDIIVVSLIIFLNSFFVISEIAILTSAKMKLQKMAQSGNKGAKYAINLTEKPESFLSAVQIGITLMSILIGFYGGTAISEYFIKLFEIHQNIHLAKYSKVIGNIVAFSLITYFTILSEVVPKRIAMSQPERFASIASYGMVAFLNALYPLIYIFTLSTRFFVKILNIKQTRSVVSINEIKFLVTQAENVGALEKIERDMIKRLVHLNDMQVGAIMTPRNKIVCLNLTETDASNINKLREHDFNCFPVINGDLGSMVGVVAVKTLLNMSIHSINNSVLQNMAKASRVCYIPEVAQVTKLIELFKQKHIKMAIVLDEYGEIEGLVTFHDVLKTFVGDLAALIEGRKPVVMQQKDGSFVVDGNITIEEVMEMLHLDSLPGEEEEDYRTLASFVLKQLNNIPKAGDKFVTSGWEFNILNMDKFRIEKVHITKAEVIDEIEKNR